MAMNFAATVDGRATIGGVSGPIGSSADTEMLAGLRTRFDAVMIGAGTMRAERYGRLVADQEKRERRERIGLPHDPLMVIVSGRLDLPWDAPLFTEGGGRVLIFTASEARAARDRDLAAGRPPRGRASTSSRRCATCAQERGVRGAALRGRAAACTPSCRRAGLVDDLFLTIAPKLAGGERAAHPRGRAARRRAAGAGLAAGGGRRALRPLPRAER